MSNREVAGLQALAKRHGGSLSVNPDTGLPEAGFLDSILPTIAGAGLTYFSGGAIKRKNTHLFKISKSFIISL
jgi:hypothetical protein